VNATGGRVDAFGERGVDVHPLGDLFSCRPQFDSEDEFLNDFGALFADDVRAE
jgi:hypothetical protein